METELRRLTVGDGQDVYDMLQEIPEDENGFMNGAHGLDAEGFRQWLARSDDHSNGAGLEDWMVPQTVYWLYADGVPVAVGKLRHWLTDKLLIEGGHIGYAVRPSQRGRGYGRLLLKLLLEQARRLGIDRVLLTIRNGNVPSVRTALGNGGIIEKTTDEKLYIWIDC